MTTQNNATEKSIQFVDRLRTEAAQPTDPVSTEAPTKETQILPSMAKAVSARASPSPT